MTDRIIELLIKYQIIDSKEEEIYRFGLEALFLKAVHYISYLLIAVFCQEVPRFILFFVAFLLVRKNAGGYHAETKLGCYVTSCGTVLGVLLLMKYIDLQGAVLIVGMLLLMISDGIILWLAPLGNKNRELDEDERRYFRKRSIRILGLENILVLFLLIIHKNDFSMAVILAIMCSAFLLILVKGKQNRHGLYF